MELFARCGIIKDVAKLKNKYERLLSLIDDDLNVDINIDRCRGRGWSPYFGFALEENWKNDKKIQCDILFRTLLIIHFVECVQ